MAAYVETGQADCVLTQSSMRHPERLALHFRGLVVPASAGAGPRALHLHPRKPLHRLRHGVHGHLAVALRGRPRGVPLDCIEDHSDLEPGGHRFLRRSVLIYSAPIMPRDGAQTLSEVPGPVLSIVCEPCGRRERCDVERLTRQNGRTAKEGLGQTPIACLRR